MKTVITAISIICIFCFSKCKKDKPDSNGLPAATQEGKNTLGFLLNGQPWTPQGVRGTGNLSIDYDGGFKQGIFSIVAYNFKTQISEQFIIGVRDSLNFINAPITLSLDRLSLYSVSYNTPCDYFNQLNDVTSSGKITITKLDRTNRIISGTFSATLTKSGCSEIKITDGRFDMKF
jgi:hypothetical protein